MAPLNLQTAVELNAENSDFFEVFDNERLAAVSGYGDTIEKGAKKLKRQTGVDTRLIFKQGASSVEAAHAVTDLLMQRMKDLFGTRFNTNNIGGVFVAEGVFDATQPQQTADTVTQKLDITYLDHAFGLQGGCAEYVHMLAAAQEHEDKLSPGQVFALLNIERLMIDVKDHKAGPLFAHRVTASALGKLDGHKLLFAEHKNVTPTKQRLHDGEYAFKIETVESATGFYGEALPNAEIIRMNGNAAYINGQDLILKSLDGAINTTKDMGVLDANPKQYCIPHQPNGRMVNSMAQAAQKEHGVEFVTDFSTMSNVASATIPSTIARLHNIKPEGIEQGSVVYMPVAGICLANREKMMSTGAAAFIW